MNNEFFTWIVFLVFSRYVIIDLLVLFAFIVMVLVIVYRNIVVLVQPCLGFCRQGYWS